MDNKFEIELKPFPYYCKYALTSYTVCEINFEIISKDRSFKFKNECTDKILLQILNELKYFSSGKSLKGNKISFSIPWICGGHEMYPYSFKISESGDKMIFYYNFRENGKKAVFTYSFDRKEATRIRNAVYEQMQSIDWNSLGKTELYTFDFIEKEFEWCYSAKALEKELFDLCKENEIINIYVSATNYSDPLTVKDNYVNYYVGSEIIIQFKKFVLDLVVFAEGLFKKRFFCENEYPFINKTTDFINDGDEEFCKIGNVYDNFKLEYQNSSLKGINVNPTEFWPWEAKGFDESKLGEEIELPKSLDFLFENGNTLSIYGYDDDFAIKIQN